MEEIIKSLEKEIMIYKDILNHIEQGIIVSDENNRILFINKALEAIEGVKGKNCYGKKMIEVYNPTPNTPNQSMHSAVLRTGIPSNEYLNEYIIKDTNQVMNVIERMFPIKNDGKVLAVYSIIKNLPILQQALEENLELKKYFLQDKKSNGTKYTFSSLIGQNISFIETIDYASRIAKNHSSVLIYGETGTGKELFSQSIHNESAYMSGQFISFNCAAIPENLLEGIFFGSVKGAYTGATNSPGLFEQAQNGTLFLDEINSMDIGLQAKLLRAIETKRVRRIGDDKDIDVNCRILCALNEDPLKAVEAGRLREDLYYRLSTCILVIPPLRKRKDDIDILSRFFITKFNYTYNCKLKKISNNLKILFNQYDWPGNVRELENMIENVFASARKDKESIEIDDIPNYHRKKLTEFMGDEIMYLDNIEEINLKSKVDNYEKKLIYEQFRKCEYNITLTSQSLGITRQSLQYKLKKYSLQIN